MRTRDLIVIPTTVGITLFGLIWGGRNSYVSIRNRAPVELTCAAYLQRRPDAEWLRLTECRADLGRIGTEFTTRRRTTATGSIKDPTAVYIRLRGEGDRGEPATILLRGDDPAMLELASAPANSRIANEIVAELAGPIEGIVELAIDRSARQKSAIRDLQLNLAEDFVILDRGKRPRPLALSLGVLVLGLGGLTVIVQRIRRRWKRRPVPLAKATIVNH
ncbi:MAG: hypothetical protein H0T89_07850 [Deltaproteobacteria bacterium]|nr:hypothetical protein [Deltaproteobacteria bacterium]MDQ3297052.1 hypothetical protein [Myxococcota bacterium]